MVSTKRPSRESAKAATEKIHKNSVQGRKESKDNGETSKKSKGVKSPKKQKTVEAEKAKSLEVSKPEEKKEEETEEEQKAQEAKEEEKIEESKHAESIQEIVPETIEELKFEEKEENVPQEKESIPDISLINQNEEGIKLIEVVKDNDTRQLTGFKDNQQEFEKFGYKVYGVTNDKMANIKKIKNTQSITYDLLNDSKNELIDWLECKKGSKIIRSCAVFEKEGKLKAKVIDTKSDASIEWALNIIKN